MSSMLLTEIKQKSGFESAEQEAFLQVLRTAAVLEHSAAEALKPHGLTLTQYNALRILRGAGPEGLCRNDVGSRMVTPVPDVTRLLDRLVERGLVVKHRDEEDRRYVTAQITDKGLALLEELDEPVREIDRKLLGHLPKGDLRRLSDLLEAVRRRA